MGSASRSGWDVLAAIAAILALVMMGLYIGLIRQQGEQVAIWFVVGLAVAALLSMYGAVRRAPRRRLVLTVAGVAMLALGLVSLLSIGFPILVAGAVAVLAAARAGNVTPRSAR